jgi:hypothetical protein
MGSNDPRERIAIGDRQTAIPEFASPIDQFVCVRGTFEKGEIGFAVQFHIIHRPSMYRNEKKSALHSFGDTQVPGTKSGHCDLRERRHFLKIGGLGGLSLPQILHAQETAPPAKSRSLDHKES